MDVLLLQNVAGLGRKGDVKTVKEGYFINFLLPRKMAILATEGRVKEAASKKEKEVIQKERIKEEAKDVAKKLDGLSLLIKAKAKGDKLYGSITEKDLIALIKEKTNIELDKEHIKLLEHLKVVGRYEVPVHIAGAADAKIHVEIKGE
jgi:large subunit ribosomal protein L9